MTSEVMMDISIKVNIGSPLLSRDQCVGENELETNDTEGEEETAEHISSPDKSGSESSPGTNTGTCVHSSSPPKPSMAKENHTTTTPSTTTCICTSTANTGSDYQLAMPPCSPSDQPMPGATPTGDDGGEEGDKLNKTFTIESPEKDMSEGTTDPLAALNESLTLTSSSKQTGRLLLCLYCSYVCFIFFLDVSLSSLQLWYMYMCSSVYTCTCTCTCTSLLVFL